MTMRRIDINGSLLEMPASWDELKAVQLEHLAEIAGMGLNSRAALTDLFVFLMDARLDKTMDGLYSLRMPDGMKYKLDAWQMDYMVDAIGWMATENGTLDLRLYSNPYGALRIGRRTFFSSKSRMNECVYEQFMYLQFYLKLMEGEKRMLPYVLACVWHSRKRFDPEMVHEDARTLEGLPGKRKTVMLWYILSALGLMQERFPSVFAGKQEGGANVYEEQMRIVNAMAEGDVTKMEAVRKAPLYDALLAMEESVRQAKEMERVSKR